MFWIPAGIDAREGVYVRYPAEELYALISLESHRRPCTMVGENLGIVPAYVNRAMSRHGLKGIYVLQYALTGRADDAMDPVPEGCIASMNTHDTPLFAGFWAGQDIEEREALGLLDREEAWREREERAGATRALRDFLHRRGSSIRAEAGLANLLRASLVELARSRAACTLVTLEDLWLETEPQNVPGSGFNRPNWQRKARYSFEELSELPEVIEAARLLREATAHG